jgi:hypothetical protein
VEEAEVRGTKRTLNRLLTDELTREDALTSDFDRTMTKND